MRYLLLPLLLVSALAQADVIRSERVNFVFEELHDGSDVIWGFDFVSANQILIAERGGAIWHLDLDSRTAHPVTGGPRVAAERQGGLLDLQVREEEGVIKLYLTYSEESDAGLVTSLGRAVWDGQNLSGFERIFQADNAANGGIHFGSRIVFDQNGHLFMTIGDRNDRYEAQSLENHKGAILRLTLQGEAAPDNPFAGRGAPEIWSYGHRNPQGIDIHPETGELYAIEFGPRGGDELNLIRPGVNYGWPEITYGREYSGLAISGGRTEAPDMEQPVIYFVPAISPSGMGFYRGDAMPEWKHDLFVANLSGMHILRLRLDGDQVVEQERLLDNISERFRQVRTGPDGLIYVSTDSGKIIRLKPE